MDDQPLRTHAQSADSETATVAVDPDVRREYDVDPRFYGKFVEHLYSSRNVTNSLEAQVLYNPTFGSWKFQVPSPGPDGGRPAEHDPETIDERVERYVDVHDLPDADRLLDAYRCGTAMWWFPLDETVTTSPDVGTAGDRAQRVAVGADVGHPTGADRAIDGGSTGADERADRTGIAQWFYLPTHRTRSFEGKLTIRTAATGNGGGEDGGGAESVTVAVHDVASDGAVGDSLAESTVEATEEYRTLEFDLDLPDAASDERGTVFAVSLTVEPPANVVVDRVLVYPDDHVGTADPEIVGLLRDADLPLLRWPGGNFVSGYHWKDGIGPVEERPTKPNPAWDGLETNLFGTDEFAAFCEAVGCEPMICLNAGNGTAEEAADWVEYCNGDPEETEYGAVRAEHGHPEPYDVTYWEVGNEVYGPWQTSWTTPGGYADRFRRFRDAMTAVDDSIEVFACGNRFSDWNDPVVAEAGDDMDWITDHVLVGDAVDPATDPAELFGAYMGFAEQLGAEYRDLESRLREIGFEDPRLAVTELQLFSTIEGESPWDDADEGDADAGDAAGTGGDGAGDTAPGDADDATVDDEAVDDEAVDDETVDGGALEDESAPGERRSTWETIPTNKSISEALYDATVIHECIRLGEFVGMVTHSGTGNHGGWIQKRKGRVWADPCYHNHELAASLFGGTPVRVEVTCDTFSTETAFGDDSSELFGHLDAVDEAPVIDAMAVVDPDAADATVALVHRDARTGAIDVDVDLGDLDVVDTGTGAGASEATLRELSADSMSARNTFEDPAAVTPREAAVPVDGGTASLSLSPFTVAYLTVERD